MSDHYGEAVMRAIVQLFWAARAGPTSHTNISACQGEQHDKMANLVGSRLVPLLGECLRWPITSTSTPSLHVNNIRSGVNNIRSGVNNLTVATPELVLARREVLGVLQAVCSDGGSGSTRTSAAVESFIDCHATDKQYSRALLAPLIAQFWLRAPDADELQQQRASGVPSSSSSSVEGALALYQAQAAHLLRVLLVASGTSFLTALTVPQLRRDLLLPTSPITANAARSGSGSGSGSAAAVNPSGGLTTAAAAAAAMVVSGEASTSGAGPASACNGAGGSVVQGGVRMQIEEEEEEEEGDAGDAVASRLTKHAALSTLVLAWSESVRVLDSAPPLLQAEDGASGGIEGDSSGTFFAHFVCASQLSRLLNAMATALSASTDNDDGSNNHDTEDIDNHHHHHHHHNSNSISSRLSEMGGALVQRAHHTLARWDTGHTHPCLQPLCDDLLELQMLVVNYL